MWVSFLVRQQDSHIPNEQKSECDFRGFVRKAPSTALTQAPTLKLARPH